MVRYISNVFPLYELEMHQGTEIGRSWNKLLALGPKKVYYGHAKTAVLEEEGTNNQTTPDNKELYALVSKIMKYIDKGYSMEKIYKKTSAELTFIEDVNRMYLTHQNVGVQGILDRIEIKNK